MSRVIYLLLSFYYYYYYSIPFLFLFGPPLTKTCPKPKWHLPNLSYTPRSNWLLSQHTNKGLLSCMCFITKTISTFGTNSCSPHALSTCMHGWPLAMHHAWELLQPHLHRRAMPTTFPAPMPSHPSPRAHLHAKRKKETMPSHHFF